MGVPEKHKRKIVLSVCRRGKGREMNWKEKIEEFLS